MRHATLFRVTFIACCVIAILPCRPAHGQYWGERVLEKSFERTDFFFSPSFLNPFAVGGFGSAAVGLIPDPLLNVQINPSYLATDSLNTHYAYLDFRNSREIEQRSFYPYYADFAFRADRIAYSYPMFFARSRTRPDPLVSGAYLFRPRGRWSNLSLGGSYQLVFQDERYYAVPQDIYRANPTEAFAGADRAAAENAIPIVDRFSGADGMNQRGHFLSLYGAYRVLPKLDVGVRLGRTLFGRDGSFGSRNLWPSSFERESSRHHMEDRDQSYGHWDMSAGLNYRLSPEVVVGFSGGVLWGEADQDLIRDDSSISRYRSQDDRYRSEYFHSGFDDQAWTHDGTAVFGGVNLLADLSPRTKLHVYYRRNVGDVDLASRSAIADTSFGTSHSEYNSYFHDSEYHSSVFDVRSGSGREEQGLHRTAVYFQWTVNDETSVQLGGNLSLSRQAIRTAENVLARRHNFSHWEYRQPSQQESRTWETAVDEDKTLYWDFESRVTALQIPVLFSRRLSDTFELMFGVNRRLLAWNITDVTLAVFDYREEIENGEVERKERFGERYTQPEERLTDVKTTVLAGFTIKPADQFDVRFLMVPSFAESSVGTTLREFQWWISFSAKPH